MFVVCVTVLALGDSGYRRTLSRAPSIPTQSRSETEGHNDNASHIMVMDNASSILMHSIARCASSEPLGLRRRCQEPLMFHASKNCTVWMYGDIMEKRNGRNNFKERSPYCRHKPCQDTVGRAFPMRASAGWSSLIPSEYLSHILIARSWRNNTGRKNCSCKIIRFD